MNYRMKAGTPVRDHMMMIISYLNEMEILGSEIDGETKIDMILETLPESFDTFKLNYSMNKLEYIVTELMKEIHTAEGLTKKKRTQGEVHATASTSGSMKRPRKAEKKNQPKVQKKKKTPRLRRWTSLTTSATTAMSLVTGVGTVCCQWCPQEVL